jgi:hypothetical protein
MNHERLPRHCKYYLSIVDDATSLGVLLSILLIMATGILLTDTTPFLHRDKNPRPPG